ncbi:Gfo/Idh/MocA family oxidoreductase [Oceanisphaera pacifica]|uniref:Gfo/Idh/MocA family oxidoreductase n=1 Tax=Oceanisphaera pacifica TaxID=2818389 RepID=A0ABS3NI76_9GAMM|nr:Gfo/Idh/MocA family oxidoreductase [Oceanisphaera pacifica]MBO1520294.1 Gfo/Idh/MocA family oxidoreductase [Oceanisphaera pacifica]
MIKTAIVGYGQSASIFHLPFIDSLPDFELVAISTSKPEKVAQEWPEVKVYTDVDQMLAEANADLVVITAPNEVHYELGRKALNMGLHVVMENPTVTQLHQGAELMRLAEGQKRCLIPFHNRRWDSDFVTLQALLKAETLGPIHGFESHFDRFRPRVRAEQPGVGAGVWFDLGGHLVDQVLVLFGKPQSVTARCLSMRPGSEVTDYFHVQLHYRDKEVVLHSSPYHPGPTLRFKLQGELGCYIKRGFDPQEERLQNGIVPDSPFLAKEAVDDYGIFYSDDDAQVIESEIGGYRYFYQATAQAIRGEAPPPVSMQDALDGLNIINLAEKSSAEGRTVPLTATSFRE